MRRIANDDTRPLDDIVYVLSVELPQRIREFPYFGQFDRPDCS